MLRTGFCEIFFTRTFGAELSSSLFDLQSDYYRLCNVRKPETVTTDWVNGLSPGESVPTFIENMWH